MRALALACVVGLFAVRAAAINIDSCGTTVPDGAVAVLTADLSCASGTAAVRLGAGSVLNMNGRTIDAPDGWGVWCIAGSKCTVNGGGGAGFALGLIRGGQAGIYLGSRARLVADGIVIQDCVAGVLAEDWHATRGATARLINLTITGSEGTGVRVGRVKADTVTITGNPGTGIAAGSDSALRARGLMVTNNAFSAGCDVHGCEGIDVGELSGTNLVVSGNAGIGIRAREARLRKSTVVDNIRAGVIKDIVTAEKPRLSRVACNASFGWGSQSSTHWGVCALDNVP